MHSGSPQYKQKGNILIFLLIGIVVLATAGGAFYLGRQTTPKPPTPIATSQTPQPAPIPTQTPIVDETVNWKTYTGKYFSLKYPESWKIDSSELSSPVTPNLLELARFITNRNTSQQPAKPRSPADDTFPPSRIARLEIYVTTNSIEKEGEKNNHGENVENTSFQGIPARKQSGSAGAFVVTNYFVHLMTNRDGKTYVFRFLTDDDKLQKQFESEFNQILSTFKFL